MKLTKHGKQCSTPIRDLEVGECFIFADEWGHGSVYLLTDWEAGDIGCKHCVDIVTGHKHWAANDCAVVAVDVDATWTVAQ